MMSPCQGQSEDVDSGGTGAPHGRFLGRRCPSLPYTLHQRKIACSKIFSPRYTPATFSYLRFLSSVGIIRVLSARGQMNILLFASYCGSSLVIMIPSKRFFSLLSQECLVTYPSLKTILVSTQFALSAQGRHPKRGVS